MAVCASFVEHAHRDPKQRTPLKGGAVTFMVYSGVATVGFEICAFYTFAEFERVCGFPSTTGNICPAWPGERTIPPYVTAFFDYSWFVCFLFTPLFLPPNPVPFAKLSLLLPEDGDKPNPASVDML